jgi:hypothetical protein
MGKDLENAIPEVAEAISKNTNRWCDKIIEHNTLVHHLDVEEPDVRFYAPGISGATKYSLTNSQELEVLIQLYIIDNDFIKNSVKPEKLSVSGVLKNHVAEILDRYRVGEPITEIFDYSALMRQDPRTGAIYTHGLYDELKNFLEKECVKETGVKEDEIKNLLESIQDNLRDWSTKDWVSGFLHEYIHYFLDNEVKNTFKLQDRGTTTEGFAWFITLNNIYQDKSETEVRDWLSSTSYTDIESIMWAMLFLDSAVEDEDTDYVKSRSGIDWASETQVKCFERAKKGEGHLSDSQISPLEEMIWEVLPDDLTDSLLGLMQITDQGLGEAVVKTEKVINHVEGTISRNDFKGKAQLTGILKDFEQFENQHGLPPTSPDDIRKDVRSITEEAREKAGKKKREKRLQYSEVKDDFEQEKRRICLHTGKYLRFIQKIEGFLEEINIEELPERTRNELREDIKYLRSFAKRSKDIEEKLHEVAG